MLLMCVICAAHPHSIMVSFNSNPATWFLSLPAMIAVLSVKVAVELVGHLDATSVQADQCVRAGILRVVQDVGALP
jgi:hypothetical protein